MYRRNFNEWLAAVAALGRHSKATLGLPLLHQTAFASSQPGPWHPCPLMPPEHALNTPIDHLPVEERSADFVRSIGAGLTLHADFGSAYWNGAPNGIPFNLVDRSTPLAEVSFEYATESDPGPYPIPAQPLIEGGPRSTGDRHILMLNRETCVLHELFDAHPVGPGRWRAGSGARFDLRSTALRPLGWTSADAAGLPILPFLAHFEEAASGEIRHALRFTVPRTRNSYVWPASHRASVLTDANLPPMGQRFRLKTHVNAADFGPQARAIVVAMQRYGLILADNGGPWFISGAPHPGWNDRELRQLKRLRGEDFEAVNSRSLMIDPTDARARQVGVKR